jgi:hypothetical protein
MFQPCLRLIQDPAYPGQNGPNHIKRILDVIVIARGRRDAHGQRLAATVTGGLPECGPFVAHLPVEQGR